MTLEQFFKELESSAERAFQRSSDQVLKKFSNNFKLDLQTNVRRQKWPWPPLSAAHAKRKKKLRLDPRMLIATQNMLRAIEVDKVAETDTEIVWGAWASERPVKPTKLNKNPASWLTYATLWSMHENGVKRTNLPARPSWRPTGQEYKAKSRQLSTELQAAFAATLAKDIERILGSAR